MKDKIIRELDRIEDDFTVKVVYACESGSRAWGFPSKDSDYDVRFLYINRPEWYLSVVKGRDVIERPIHDSLDINGWDLLKALRLFRKSNPSILEWINSPIVYDDMYGLGAKTRNILNKYFSQTACAYHYLHMANGNYKDYLKADTVWIKKYFYVLRPLLAVIWMEQGRGFVPVDFNKVIKHIDIPDNLRKAIEDLIVEKKNGEELGRGKRNHVISDYIERELDKQLKKNHQCPAPPAPTKLLDKLFTGLLDEVWKL